MARRKYDLSESSLAEAIRKGFPEAGVVWVEPVSGTPPGQADCMLWVPFTEQDPRWVQAELKCSPRPWSHLAAHGYYGSKARADIAERKGSEVWGLLRESQRRRAKHCYRLGIPYWVLVLRPEHQFHEVDFFCKIKAAPDRRFDSTFFHVGCIDLADITPESVALLMGRE